MNVGVTVVARNDVGEDSCKIEIRTIDDNNDTNNNGDDNSGN